MAEVLAAFSIHHDLPMFLSGQVEEWDGVAPLNRRWLSPECPG